MPIDQGCEGKLTCLSGASLKLLQQLTVGQTADCPQVEQRMDILKGGAPSNLWHRYRSLVAVVSSAICNVTWRPIWSQFAKNSDVLWRTARSGRRVAVANFTPGEAEPIRLGVLC